MMCALLHNQQPALFVFHSQNCLQRVKSRISHSETSSAAVRNQQTVKQQVQPKRVHLDLRVSTVLSQLVVKDLYNSVIKML